MQKRQIVLAGLVAAGMTARLMEENKDRIGEHFPKSFIAEAEETAHFQIDDAAFRIIRSVSGPSALLQPVGEGGLFAALWQLSETAGKGLETAFDAIPIRQELIEILNFLDVDPYTTDDAGSVLIATADGEDVAALLKEGAIPACIIGAMNDSNARTVRRGESFCYINKTEGRDKR